MSRLRVLFVEDHAFTRELIAAELRAIDPLLDVRAVAGVASAAHEIASGFSPHVVILDLRLAADDGRLGGLALLPLLMVPVVLFTAEQSPPEAVLARVAAHVVKGTPAAGLAMVVRRVAAQGTG